MPHRERKHRLLILDFQQQRIATGAEANHQFTLERFVLANFTTAQRCHFKYGDSITRELQSALGHSKISPSPLQQIAVEPRKIITRLLGKTDVEAHPGSALARLVQLGLQPGQHILHVDVVACRLGAVTRGQPACDEGFLLLALLHLGADGCSTKLDSVSPSCNTASAASRSAGSTRSDGRDADFMAGPVRCNCDASSQAGGGASRFSLQT